MSDGRDRWDKAGIGHAARRTFEEWKISYEDAVCWFGNGVTDGLTAMRWQIARVAPEGVAAWLAAGIDSVKALQWTQLGFDLEAAKQEQAAGRGPSTVRGHSQPSQLPPGAGGARSQLASTFAWSGSGSHSRAWQAWLARGGQHHHVAHLYMMAGWVDDDALPWAQAEVPPATAKAWRALGVRPQEAARLEREAVDVFQVMHDWWTSGVPLDQVATWLGAGLSAAEAAEQIAAGVTPDQAAVLRALRDEDDEA